MLFFFGPQRERAPIGRRAGTQQRVVGWLDAGWQYQGIVVDGGAAPAVLARGSIDGHRAGVDLLTALWPGLRRIVGRVAGLPGRHDQPPLWWMLRDLSDHSIKQIVLVSCLRLLCRTDRDGL